MAKPELKVAVFEAGHELKKRFCPIDGEKIKTCINCKSCSIMNGFGGAGAFSDGKYNITNDFGGTLYKYIGKKKAIELMEYVDEINMRYGGEGTKLYTTAGTKFKKECIQHDLHLLNASVRHLGTDINYVVLENIYAELEKKVDFFFDAPVDTVSVIEGGYEIQCKGEIYTFTTGYGDDQFINCDIYADLLIVLIYKTLAEIHQTCRMRVGDVFLIVVSDSVQCAFR